jgi:hypothetical protein
MPLVGCRFESYPRSQTVQTLPPVNVFENATHSRSRVLNIQVALATNLLFHRLASLHFDTLSFGTWQEAPVEGHSSAVTRSFHPLGDQGQALSSRALCR